MILLVGLIVKNGILLLDAAHHASDAGDTTAEALAHAGRMRLRPILMTTVCTLAGLVPLALGLGAGAELQRPLALAVIGGLVVSTLVTLLIVPVLSRCSVTSRAGGSLAPRTPWHETIRPCRRRCGRDATPSLTPEPVMRSWTAATARLPLLLGGLSLLPFPGTPLSAQTSGAGYHIVRDIPLGGDGRWDYITVDTAGHRLFIARQTRVMVVDAGSGKLLGEVSGLAGAHDVALAYAEGHGFATSGRDGSVTMFDLHTLKVLRRTPTAPDADAILYDPASRRIFTFNGDAHSSTAIDPVSGAVVGTFPLDGRPEFGVPDGAGKVYVNIEDKGEVAEIDPVGLRVTRRWSIGPCEGPTGSGDRPRPSPALQRWPGTRRSRSTARRSTRRRARSCSSRRACTARPRRRRARRRCS